MNRIEAAISRTRTQAQERLSSGQTTEAQIKLLHSELDMEIGEFCRFQDLKSLAFAEGKLSLEEANTIYSFLGESPDHFNSQAVEVKSVLTMVFHELLKKTIQ